MKISKQDALTWFRFFAELPEERTFCPISRKSLGGVFAD